MIKEESFILSKLREGDISAMEILYIRYAPQVRSFVFSILKNSEDTDDLVHDIFIKVWEKREIICQVKSFKAYLFTTTRNTVYNKLKHDRVHQKYVNYSSKNPANYDTEKRVVMQDLLDLINKEIDSLTEQQKIIYKLSRYDNLTYKEIAEKMGISPKTVQYHIGNILSRLKKIL